MRNPPWNRDELILALAAYFRAGRRILDPSDPAVVELSSVLNSLGVHDGQSKDQAFRNPNGVSMKMANFSSIDPERQGVGLKRGNQLERVIWDEFASAPPKLYEVAAAIGTLAGPNSVKEPIRGWDPDGEEEEFREGKLLTRLHIARERSPALIRKKKAAVLQRDGRLRCECCDFDFASTYGKLGEAFAECHHRVPLHKLTAASKTKLADLAIVCANCHRMLHRADGLMTVSGLRKLIAHNARR